MESLKAVFFEDAAEVTANEYRESHDGKVKIRDFINRGLIYIGERISANEADSVLIGMESRRHFIFTFYQGARSEKVEVKLKDGFLRLVKKWEKKVEDMEYNLSLSDLPMDMQLKLRRNNEDNRIAMHAEIADYLENEINKGGVTIRGGSRELSLIVIDMMKWMEQ